MVKRASPRFRFLGRHLLAGALAGAVLGGADGLLVLRAATEPSGAGPLLVSSGLGFLLGLALGAVGGGIAALSRLDTSAEDGLQRSLWPARLITLVIVWSIMALPFGWLTRMILTTIVRMENKLAALVVIVVVAFGLVWIPANWITARLARLLDRWLPQPLSSVYTIQTIKWILAFLLLAIAVASGIFFRSQLVLAYGTAPFFGCLLLVVAYILAAFLLLKAGVRLLWIVLLVLSIAAAFCFVLPLGEKSTAHALLNYSRLVPTPLRWVWSLMDEDGDGFASGLGSVDCDDSDPNVHPMAADMPQNGRDENCSGQDASFLPSSFAPARLSLTPFSGQRPQNVVLITGEGIRADRLDRQRRNAYKNLASFASEAFIFTRAYAPSPRTNASMTGVMFGRYPSRLDWDISAIPLRLLSKQKALAEILQGSGYTTYAFINDRIHLRIKHIQSGFTHVERALHPRGSSVLLVEKAIETIKRHSDEVPFFLWIHLYDPHLPYIDGYNQEIQRVDEQTGKLVAVLRQRGDWSRTAVIFSADHAEALGDHQIITHSQTVYDSEIHVPLFIRVPGLRGGRRTGHVTLVDMMPTILDLLGISSELEFDGRSLLPQMLDARRAETRPVFAVNCFPVKPLKRWIAVYWQQWKLVRRIHEGRDELFDIQADPQESHDLSGQGIEILEALKLEASRFWKLGSWSSP